MYVFLTSRPRDDSRRTICRTCPPRSSELAGTLEPRSLSELHLDCCDDAVSVTQPEQGRELASPGAGSSKSLCSDLSEQSRTRKCEGEAAKCARGRRTGATRFPQCSGCHISDRRWIDRDLERSI
eukprot:765610-Hanusia_phi.AAC.2